MFGLNCRTVCIGNHFQSLFQNIWISGDGGLEPSRYSIIFLAGSGGSGVIRWILEVSWTPEGEGGGSFWN